MMDTLSAIDENSKPICHGSPRSLLELASIKMALNIWLQKFNEFYQPGNNTCIEITKLDFHYEGSIAVPHKIKKIIDSRMYPIANELNKWVRYIKTVLGNFSYNQIYSRFNLVVFGGNGTVHFKDTIANFLEDDSLNNVTRFEIASVNCVEEKIDFFWPLVSSTLNIDLMQFDDDFMLYYWICRKKGELHRISLRGFSSIESLMIDKCRKCIHLAIEYYLKKLNPDDRLFELEKLLNPDDVVEELDEFNCAENRNFTLVFPNIDGPIQRQILDRNIVEVLYYFVTCLKPVEYSVQCFLHIKDMITPECYYGEVIMGFINYIYESSTFYKANGASKREGSFWYKQIEITLEQIWLNTPPHLKECTLEHLSIVFEEYNSYYWNCLRDFGRDIRFLLAVLSDANVELRSRVFIEYWPDWIEGVPPSQFEELIELCLMKTEAIKEFKSIFPYTEKFQPYCDRLIREGYFTELDEFLSCLYSDHGQVLNIKKHILTNGTIIFHGRSEVIEKFAKYIDDSFSNNALAADFKDNIIFSDVVLKILSRKQIFGNNDLRDIKFIVSLFVSPQRQAEIKNRFLESFYDKMTSGGLYSFNEDFWSEFLFWCTDSNEQLVDDFMKSLPIDVVFEKEFCICLDPGIGRTFRKDRITSLDRFLKWYFKSESVSENYIREKVEYYERMDAEEVERIFNKDKQIVIDSMKNELLKNDNRCVIC